MSVNHKEGEEALARPRVEAWRAEAQSRSDSRDGVLGEGAL